MKQKIFTPISKLGELNLIKRITKGLKIKHFSTKMGIGDDTAVLAFEKNKRQLVSTDMLIEGVHFDPIYTPLSHLGYKSIIVNISDICSMNGLPTHALVSLAIPNKYSVEHLEELYSGIKKACQNYNIDLIGGDTTSSSTGLVICVTVLGESEEKKISYRGGAKPNDILLVSGPLGGAYLGLQILEREKQIFNTDNTSQPALDQYKGVLEKQLKPEARVDLISFFKELKITPSSMIDISDGLSSDVGHICNSSNVGVKIFEEKIPVSKESQKVCKEFQINPVICALHGGEDYELLFTLSQKDYQKVTHLEALVPIGHITSGNDMSLVLGSGQSISLIKEGWDSFLKQKTNI
tara:strand:+ start:2358 stop:3410 length:1053 start_codon:yes stop_codon:yes gene_type:complete